MNIKIKSQPQIRFFNIATSEIYMYMLDILVNNLQEGSLVN